MFSYFWRTKDSKGGSKTHDLVLTPKKNRGSGWCCLFLMTSQKRNYVYWASVHEFEGNKLFLEGHIWNPQKVSCLMLPYNKFHARQLHRCTQISQQTNRGTKELQVANQGQYHGSYSMRAQGGTSPWNPQNIPMSEKIPMIQQPSRGYQCHIIMLPPIQD